MYRIVEGTGMSKGIYKIVGYTNENIPESSNMKKEELTHTNDVSIGGEPLIIKNPLYDKVIELEKRIEELEEQLCKEK